MSNNRDVVIIVIVVIIIIVIVITKYSKVLSISNIDFIPDDITAVLVWPNSVRSVLISKPNHMKHNQYN